MQSETQWVMVPREPTREMRAVGRDMLRDLSVEQLCTSDAADTYRAMIAAAPTPPAGGEAVTELEDLILGLNEGTRAEIRALFARLRAELAKVASVVDNDVRLMDPPDGGDPTTAEKVANLRALYEAAEARALAAEAKVEEMGKALEALVYRDDGRWFAGVIGDTDVTDIVAPALQPKDHDHG